MAIISPNQTDALSPVNVALMEEVRKRSNSAYQTGDIKWHHSFNGAVLAGAGWFKCNGQVINQTNYDAQRGVGAWAAEVGTSLLDGKYSPNLIDKYPVGVAVTTQTGVSAITPVGNPNKTVNFSHSHGGTSTVSNNSLQIYNGPGVANSLGTVIIQPYSIELEAYIMIV